MELTIRQRLTAWLAVLAMALNALWPLLAAANPGVPEPFGVPVCTPEGLVMVFDAGRQLPNPEGPAHRLMPHCAFCSLAAGHAVLHSPGLLALQAERPLAERPSGDRSVLVPWFLSASLRSRSPPVQA